MTRRCITRSHLLRGGGALAASAFVPGIGTSGVAAQSREDEQIALTVAETATIDGRQIDGRTWDTPLVGGRTVDAVHRSVLLRFPGAADQIALLLREGRVLTRAELMLAYEGYEIVPEGYLCRPGLGRRLWTDDPPTWHLQVWPLRRPWVADATHGPTFNASVAGRCFWTRFGAADPMQDRHAELMQTVELSHKAREARIDITRLLASDVLAKQAGVRLLALEQNGFLLRKLETYDSRYRQPGNAYEWAMPTGGHGLTFASPRLVLTCRSISGRGVVAVRLPTRIDPKWLMATPDGSRPTATMPTTAAVAARARKILSTGLRERSDWQAARIRELLRVGGDRASPWLDPAAHAAQIREVLATPPRYWQGWSVADDLLAWFMFRELLPAPVQDHLKEYWRAWLQPDLPTKDFFHPSGKEAMEDYGRRHDWRGRASFFRDGFNFYVSTQNFNHTAAMGALLGGHMIGSDLAIADGRHGLEALPLRYWGFVDGSAQEMLDHYYLSISLSAQKMIADHAPQPIDRLMGRILVDRTMELLVSTYHPRLRRCVSSSGRARMSGVLVEQDGIYGALHTLSKAGVVNHLDRPSTATAAGMPIWGYDFPAGRVAVQSLPSRWLPDWVSGLVDDKPVPFEETAAETVRKTFNPPLWRRAWLGRWHGLASTDIRNGAAPLVGQWVREPRTATRMEDLGTLTARYLADANPATGPDLTATQGGSVATAGLTLVYQSRNRAIVFAKPHTWRPRFLKRLARGQEGESVSRLATVIGLWNFAERRSWEIHAGAQRLATFPQRLPAGQRIFVRDGVAWFALLPLPASDLGRDAEIEIAPGVAGKAEPNDAQVAPALTISLFNLRRARPVAVRSLDLDAITQRTFGGFVLEMGDAEQHGSFEAFVQHMNAATLETQWHEDKRLLEISYRSGGDLMEAGFTTDFPEPADDHFPIRPGLQEKAIPWRRLNGAWPYLPAGLERDTTWSQQGTTGRLEKNGAVLTGDAGGKSYLLADPLSGAVIAYNPLPDPQSFTLSTRDGARFTADGKVGLLRLEYRPWEKACDLTHALKTGQDPAGLAKTITISGLAEAPRVTLNGRAVEVQSEAQPGSPSEPRPESRSSGRTFGIPLAGS
ncbi:MAG: hypothetical protein AB7F22_16060 [Reyranella sp.]|uniref:hypothetical protein n=1 Tax=Reyranella sp. TaxID=1929291 RepID=UPI003D0ED95D